MSGDCARAWDEPFRSISREAEQRRRTVTAQLLDALATLADSWSPAPFWRDTPKLECAVAHHAIQIALQASRTQDLSLARTAQALLETPPRLVATSAGPLIVADMAACLPGVEGQGFLIDPTAAVAALADDEVRAAVDAVVGTGLGEWLRHELAVVVLLGRVANESATRAFSVATLPGTVFLEWTPLAARAGELLLHECGHSWLNEALSLYGEELDGPARWYSPWKRCQRSAFGIVHAVVSFSLLVDYFARLEEGAASDAVVEFAQHRRGAEAARLRLVRPAAVECIEQVREPRLRTVLRGMLDDAVGGASSQELAAWTTDRS